MEQCGWGHLRFERPLQAAGSAAATGLRRWTLQAREQPTTHAEVVEYLLSTEGDEMQFEVARTRPLLTPELFDFLREQTSAPSAPVPIWHNSSCRRWVPPVPMAV